MNEKEFTHALVDRLRAFIKDLEVETGRSIFYSVYIDETGNIPLHLNPQREPMRGEGTGFEQDILLFERVSCQTSIIPRVAVEVKFRGVTTHDALVYSAKAERIRNVYPYLRYGLILGDMNTIPSRVLRLGREFDFMVQISNPPTEAELDRLAKLLADEVETSRKLGKVFFESTKVSIFRRRIDIEPNVELAPITKKLIYEADNQIQPSVSDNKFSISYFVYENWTAENKARINYGHCTFCNYGKGIHPDAGNRNGRWHGPFNNFAEAKEAADNTGREVSVCKMCNPQ
jgi:hypothetical protein